MSSFFCEIFHKISLWALISLEGSFKKRHETGPFSLTGKGGYAMGILDKFRREGASGGYVSDLCIAKVSLTFYAFSLIFTGFTPETPKRGNPFWRIHGINPALGGIESTGET